jgi:hypothetical protein
VEYDALADNCGSFICHDIFYFMLQGGSSNDPESQFKQETSAAIQDNTQNIEQLSYSTSEIATALGEPTGFETRTGSAFTITDGTRKVEVTVVSGYYTIWFLGVKHTIRATKDITFADTEGLHAVYFDDDDTLKEYVNPTVGNMLTLIRDKCLVTAFWWDATNNVSIIPTEERHGTSMDGMTHYWAHYSFGLQYISGFAIGDTVIGDGSLDTHAQFSIGVGSVADEDIGISMSAIAVGTGGSILYKDGAAGNWRKTTQTGFWVKKSGSATDRLYYNQYTGGAWQLTEVGEGNYVLCHFCPLTGIYLRSENVVQLFQNLLFAKQCLLS